MIELNTSEILRILTDLMGIAILGQGILYLFSPTFYFSRAPNSLLIYYISKMIRLVTFKLLNLAFLLCISSLCFPLLFIIDYILMEYFKVYLDWNIYNALFLAIGFSFCVSTFFIWLEERQLLISGQLEKYSYDFKSTIINHHNVDLNNRLRGVKFFVDTSEDIVAYTYGGIFLAPRIVISKHLLTPAWQDQLLAVLLHELNHIERRDNIWSLIVVCYDRIVKFTLRIISLPFQLISRIVILGLIARPILVIIENIYQLWAVFLGMGNYLKQLSEEFADTEVYGLVPSTYLIEALNDCQDGKLRHYTFVRNEIIAQEIIKREETKYRLGFYKQSFSIKNFINQLLLTHPPLYARWFMGGSFSNGKLVVADEFKVKSRFTPYVFISICLIAFFLFIKSEYNKNKNYQLKDKDYLRYSEYLKRKIK